MSDPNFHGFGKSRIARIDMVPKLIRANGTIEPVRPKNGKVFTYEELSGFVGGYIEHIVPPGQTGAVMIVNEEGKLQRMPLNRMASAIWQEGCDPGSPRDQDYVVGDVLLCHHTQID